MNDQKIDNLLNLALEATQREREDSLVLDVGYVPEEQVWDLIVRYTGDIWLWRRRAFPLRPLREDTPLSLCRNPVSRSSPGVRKLNISRNQRGCFSL